MKKIAILFNLNRHQFEYETEFDSELTIDSIYETLSKNYKVKKIEADKNFKWIDLLLKYNPDLVFNICEGYYGPARESVYAAILEQFKINYSGPDSTNLLMCHNKFLVKNILMNYIDVPRGYSICKEEDIDKLKNISYPLIVKLNSEGSSMGMNEKSIVYNFDDLKKQVLNLLKEYDRNVLVEEFIDGQDISMIFVEGIGALGPCIVNCESKFYDYEMKTIKDDTVDIKVLDGNYEELKNIVKLIAKRLDIKGYAKIDFRIKNGKYYLIEVNSQVSFHPTGEFITCAKKDGYSFNDIILFIVDNALKNKNKKNSIGYKVIEKDEREDY
jgi:D-alanine--D-alanine ligase